MGRFGSGSLTIVKNTTNADGTFGFTVMEGDQVAKTVTVLTSGGSGSETLDIAAGRYSIAEDMPLGPGWSLDPDGVECRKTEVLLDPGNFVINTGDTVTCIFSNTYTPADLTLVKVLEGDTPPDGINVGSWTLIADGVDVADALQGFSGVTGEVTPGTYALSEIGPSGPDWGSNWECYEAAASSTNIASGCL